jgi:hypothetical protein
MLPVPLPLQLGRAPPLSRVPPPRRGPPQARLPAPRPPPQVAPPPAQAATPAHQLQAAPGIPFPSQAPQFGAPAAPPSLFASVAPATSLFGAPAASLFGAPSASQFGAPALPQFGAPAPAPAHAALPDGLVPPPHQPNAMAPGPIDPNLTLQLALAAQQGTMFAFPGQQLIPHGAGAAALMAQQLPVNATGIFANKFEADPQ